MSERSDAVNDRSGTVSGVLAVIVLFVVVIAELGHPVLAGGIAALALAVQGLIFEFTFVEVRA